MEDIINSIKSSQANSTERAYWTKQYEVYLKVKLNYYYRYPIEVAKNLMNKIRKEENPYNLSYYLRELEKVLKSNKERIDRIKSYQS